MQHLEHGERGNQHQDRMGADEDLIQRCGQNIIAKKRDGKAEPLL